MKKKKKSKKKSADNLKKTRKISQGAKSYGTCVLGHIIFGVSKVKRRLQRLVRVFTCQNVKLLEISCRGSELIWYFLSFQNFGSGETGSCVQPGVPPTSVYAKEVCHTHGDKPSYHHRNRPQCLHRDVESTA